jgi:transposase
MPGMPHSDDCFAVETSEAFLEGHLRAFAYFGGVLTRILYDNTKIAVEKILGSKQRQRTRAFSKLRIYYLFADKLGRPATNNNKGQGGRTGGVICGGTSWLRNYRSVSSASSVPSSWP